MIINILDDYIIATLINCLLYVTVIDLIKKMMNVDPKKRITIDEVLKHPWLKVMTSYAKIIVYLIISIKSHI